MRLGAAIILAARPALPAAAGRFHSDSKGAGSPKIDSRPNRALQNSRNTPASVETSYVGFETVFVYWDTIYKTLMFSYSPPG